MKKEMSVLATIALAAALSSISFARQQDQSSQPSSPSTQQQQPSSPSQNSASPAEGPSSQSQASSFTGKIVKAGDKFVLRANGQNYQLDDQEKAKKFAGQQVKVSGDLDSSTSTIRVADISPASLQ
jgi:uncharacterized protein YdeI (BOF family)